MKQRGRVVLTTTTSLEGWKIEEYLGPVFAHFVIGTGLFADIFSAFTDFFGAHSRSYQQKLDLINREALAQIEAQAALRGANAVVGLSVDHDEISGAGKSMLMVSASGTAVRARRLEPTMDRQDLGPADEKVSAGALQSILRRRVLLEQAEAGVLDLDDEENWRFILENSMDELAPYIIRSAQPAYPGPYTDATAGRRTEQFRQYFLSLSPETAKRYLYACLGADGRLWDTAFSVIRDGNLFDGRMMLEVLRGDDARARMRSLQLVLTDPPYYSVDDIPLLEELAAEIRKQFPQASSYTAKGVFGEKEVWKCACGKEVKVSAAQCDSCRRDRYGFPPGVVTVDQALDTLRRKIEILEASLRKEAGAAAADDTPDPPSTAEAVVDA